MELTKNEFLENLSTENLPQIKILALGYAILATNLFTNNDTVKYLNIWFMFIRILVWFYATYLYLTLGFNENIGLMVFPILQATKKNLKTNIQALLQKTSALFVIYIYLYNNGVIVFCNFYILFYTHNSVFTFVYTVIDL